MTCNCRQASSLPPFSALSINVCWCVVCVLFFLLLFVVQGCRKGGAKLRGAIVSIQSYFTCIFVHKCKSVPHVFFFPFRRAHFGLTHVAHPFSAPVSVCRAPGNPLPLLTRDFYTGTLPLSPENRSIDNGNRDGKEPKKWRTKTSAHVILIRIL